MNGATMRARFADAGRGGATEDQATLKRYHRADERHVEFCPKSTNPEHEPIRIDLETAPFEIVGVAVGALIGDGFNRPGYDCIAV